MAFDDTPSLPLNSIIAPDDCDGAKGHPAKVFAALNDIPVETAFASNSDETRTPKDDDAFCSRCKSIDLDILFEQGSFNELAEVKILPLHASPWDLDHSSCPMCRLFGSAAPKHQDREMTCDVQILSADEVLLGGQASKSQTPAVVLGVIARSREDEQVGRSRNKQVTVNRGRREPSFKESGFLCAVSVEVSPPDLGFVPLREDKFDIDFARSCLSYCLDNHHSSCKANSIETLPSLRFMDCKTREIVPAPNDSHYVALSYVWGPAVGDTHPRTDVITSRKYFQPLPAVIEDSITVTLSMGLRYLWIDRYCIDHSDPIDQAQQINRMDIIYSNAAMTIIAAAGESPEYGLPGVGHRARRARSSLQVENRYIFRTPPHMSVSVTQTKWATRGWTYQEGLLSKRRLIFTDDQVYFECNTMRCAEASKVPLDLVHELDKSKTRTGIPEGMFSYSGAPGSESHQIISYIVEFSTRQLSYAEDSLNAMQGIFKVFETRASSPVHNLQGIPLLDPFRAWAEAVRTDGESLLAGLTWYHSMPGRRNKHFSSWTWAGWSSTALGGFLCTPYRLALWNATIKIEMPDGQLQRFLKQKHASSLTSSQRKIFLRISAMVLPCSLVAGPPPELENNAFTWGNLACEKSDSFHISLNAPWLTHLQVRLDNEDDVAAAFSAARQHRRSDSLLCVFLCSPEFHAPDQFALLVRDLGEHYERVGIAVGTCKFEWDAQQKRYILKRRPMSNASSLDGGDYDGAEFRTIRLV